MRDELEQEVLDGELSIEERERALMARERRQREQVEDERDILEIEQQIAARESSRDQAIEARARGPPYPPPRGGIGWYLRPRAIGRRGREHDLRPG